MVYSPRALGSISGIGAMAVLGSMNALRNGVMVVLSRIISD